MRKMRKQYKRPKSPWSSVIIDEERKLLKEYGLKNKTEIWRAKSKLAKFKQQAMTLLGSSGEQVKRESEQLLGRLNRMGVLKSNSLEDVLSMPLESLFERRLQTMVFQKGLANTPKQARQFVLHKHVFIGDRIVSVPSYNVCVGEEDQIRLNEDVKVSKGARRKEEGVKKEEGA